MGPRLFADGEREHRPPLALVCVTLSAGGGCFAIIVLFPRPLRYGVGFGGSVRTVYCAVVDCR